MNYMDSDSIEKVLKLILFLIVLGLVLYIPAHYWVKHKLRNEPQFARITITKAGLIVFVVLGVATIFGLGYRVAKPESEFSKIFALPGGTAIGILLLALATMAIGRFLQVFGIKLFEKKEIQGGDGRITSNSGTGNSLISPFSGFDLVSGRNRRILPQLFILCWLGFFTYDLEFHNGVIFHNWVDGYVVFFYLFCLLLFGIIVWRNIVTIKIRDIGNTLWIIVSLIGILWSLYGLIKQGLK